MFRDLANPRAFRTGWFFSAAVVGNFFSFLFPDLWSVARRIRDTPYRRNNISTWSVYQFSTSSSLMPRLLPRLFLRGRIAGLPRIGQYQGPRPRYDSDIGGKNEPSSELAGYKGTC